MGGMDARLTRRQQEVLEVTMQDAQQQQQQQQQCMPVLQVLQQRQLLSGAGGCFSFHRVAG